MPRFHDSLTPIRRAPGTTPEVGYAYADGSSGNTARRTGMTYPDGRVLESGYGATDSADDLLSRVASLAITGESGNLAQYTYVGAARYVKIAYPEPGVQLSYIKTSGQPLGDAGDPYNGYDRFGRTVDMRWVTTAGGAVRDQFQWGYDRSSNRTWRANLAATGGGQDEAYGYDGLYQVKEFAQGTLNTNRTGIGAIPVEEEGFRYDPTGNWLGYKKSEDGAIVLDQTRSNNQDNQLVQIDGSSQGIAFDRTGNATMLRPGDGGDWTKHFVPIWDAWNRLVEVKDEEGDPIATYTYDGLTRRITKAVGGTTTHCYWSDQWKQLEEREGSATDPVRQYVWGARPGHRDELILRDRDTDASGTLDERLYATMDYFNGTAILDASGNVVERYAYSAFGVRRIKAADFTPRTESDYNWEFAYKGQFRDAETGWYNYGYRYYVPEQGRWINRDPIGERGGVNVYGFLDNRPTDQFDVLGHHPSDTPNGPAPSFKDGFSSGLGEYLGHNPSTNCGTTAVRPDIAFDPKRPPGNDTLRPNPSNMENEGCREVSGADECKTEGKDCERHVIVYLPKGQNWNDETKPPNYHAAGQSECGGDYFHQGGTSGPIFNAGSDPRPEANAYYNNVGKPDQELEETHYCCPMSKK